MLPGRDAQTVNTPGAARAAVGPGQSVEELRQKALRLLHSRLKEIYSRQADLYAQEQTRLFGDADARALASIAPRLKSAFDAYSSARTPLVFELVNSAGFPDPNPTSAPPPDTLRPVPKLRWLKANEAREKVKALDKQYDETATALIAEAGHIAGEERLGLLNKIQDFRTKMNERALAEAEDPLKGLDRSIALRLAGTRSISLPAIKSATVSLPAEPALPAAPRVDSNDANAGAVGNRLLIERQLRIWLALSGRKLASGPGPSVPDVTGEFQAWRLRQQVGP